MQFHPLAHIPTVYRSKMKQERSGTGKSNDSGHKQRRLLFESHEHKKTEPEKQEAPRDLTLADAGRGVAAGGAGALLQVKAAAAAAHAQRVRLVPALAETSRTLALHAMTTDQLTHLIHGRARGCVHES